MIALPPGDVDRLAKICGRFGSEHGGERASAALKADELVKSRGTTWDALLEPLKAVVVVPGPIPVTSMLPHRRAAQECLAVDLWNERERDFLVNISRLRRSPTQGQADWLADLLTRARAQRQAA